MKKRYYISLLATALIWGAGCNKIDDFGNVNKDPNGISTPIPSALLTNVEAGIANFAARNDVAINGAQYAQYFSETQYSNTSLYSLPQISFTGYYSGSLYDLQNIINLNQSNNAVQVAKILQQYIFWTITDAWGDVPYSEALKGISAITPKYDKQEDIYKGILATLTSAVASFDNTSAIAGDVIYNGDVASWKRAANSLKLLVALQLSKKVPASSGYAATAVKEAIAANGGLITENSQNFDVNFPGGNYKSEWWNFYNGRKDYAESKTVTDITNSLNDTRQNAFGGSSEISGSTGSSNVGVPYGLARNSAIAFTDANTNWARVLRGDLRTETGTVSMITAGEVLLARAEAANIGWTTESSNDMYRQGIAKSFEQWGYTVTDTYLNQSGVNLSSGNAYNKIILQRYLASYPDGHMAWDIWRKTGIPSLTPAPDATNSSKKIVRRFTYATSEYNTNGANVREAVARIPGGDTQDSRVWWDQNN
ncbi:SusD/RagB family nutrient-binding outer membrane lipoprotein [Mucilaginibacter sp. Bleaf8]|uniref:SusD/RagB family nutrient-binding outer membrane lipoprotein n=1 Tax=Mucilaginibacter sp. Bleaf8 TaxID=2834430 RepID=UPI001BCDCFDB|nr:SusD/RagB family nutrient-binding outer membrane lipoprotein [Mucilaginibacter sp. Bleaf8]MBS7565755.1 SusD/RagB family nutrient-binding outer membrane lipoprotein [Mucilaginibacter sp. Bleaf8]